jgi:hypothetical protein
MSTLTEVKDNSLPGLPYRKRCFHVAVLERAAELGICGVIVVNCAGGGDDTPGGDLSVCVY